MDRSIRDFRLAFRSLRRQPGFAAVVIGTLALGIGVNLAVFQAIYGLVLRPLPFIDAEGLVALGMRHQTLDVEAYDFSLPDVRDFQEQCSVCTHVAGFDSRNVVISGISGGVEGAAEQGTAGLQSSSGVPESAWRVRGQAVSPELFPLLGVEPGLGRALVAADAVHERAQVVVISHGLWQRLGGEESLVGRSLELDGRSIEVVGIMPPGFRFPEYSDLWFPLEPNPETLRSERWLDNVIVRLEEGVDLGRAQAEADTLAARWAAEYPESNRGWSFTVMPFRERLVNREERSVLALLAGAVLFVLLIACVNITNLLLARESGRQQSAAIRLALGSDRLSLVRQRMTENLLLALAGGALGLLLSAWALDLLTQVAPGGWPAWMRFDLDHRSVLFTLALTLLAAFAFGLLPALRAAHPDLGRAMGAARRSAIGGEGQGLQSALVVTQIALALTLLVGAALVGRSVEALFNIDAGFDTENVLTLRTQLAGDRFDDADLRRELYDRLVQRLGTLPGVESVAASSAVPLVEDGTAIPFSYPDERLREGERQIGTYILQTPALFDVLDLPLLSGRRFTAAEARDPESRAVIVNDELARHAWGDADPIGQRLRLGYEEDAPWSTVIGVVPKIYYEEPGEETDQSRFQVHVPYARIPWRSMAVLIRTRTDPAALADTVRSELSALEPSMAIDSVRTLESLRSEVIWGERLQGDLFRTFALLALALSALGIYGVMAYVVSRRTREIGVRMALGADREAIRSLFLRRGLLLVAVGTALGLAGSWGVSRLLSSVLYGVRGLELSAFGIALLVLATAAGIGVALPAERASRIEPAAALEQD